MANSFLAAGSVVLLLSPGAAGQDRGPDDTVRDDTVAIHELQGAVRVDGDLSEWTAVPTMRLDRLEQVWSHKPDSPWGGPDDLSAEIFAAYDPAHLYVAGRVSDDSLVRGEIGREWFHGDAIELFFDLNDSEASTGGRTFDEDVIQLFLMPFSEDRLWGAVDWRADPPVPSGAGLSGLQVAFARIDAGHYAFEAAIPFHNFPALKGRRDVRFNLALDDHDEGRDRYQYMTWNGLNPVNATHRLATLRFDGRGPMAVSPPETGGLYAWLRSYAPFVLVPLAGALLFALIAWAFGALVRTAPGLRPVGRTAGVALFLVGLILPSWLAQSRRTAVEGELGRVVVGLQQHLGYMETSVLGSYRGGVRDRTLIDLLAGRTIPREQKFSYTYFPELADGGGLGAETRHLPGLGFRVRPYGIPLPQGRAELFHLGEALPAGNLNVVVARPQSALSAFAAPFAEPVRLQLTWFRSEGEGAGEAEPVSESLAVPEPFEAVSLPGLERTEMSFVTFPLARPATAVSVTCLEGDGLMLVGLTWVSPQWDRELPLFLGEDALGGVPTDLRGPWPRECGFEVGPGKTATVRIPEPSKFDKLWLFYRGSYRGRPVDLGIGTQVCEVTLRFVGEAAEPRRIGFDHQVSMFFDDDRYNQGVPPDQPVVVASRWEGEDEETRIDLMREVDLSTDAELTALEFQNTGPYPIRFRSLVFGTKVDTIPTSTGTSPLVRRKGMPGHVGLSSETLAELGAADFAIFRNGRLSSTTFGDADSQERINLPSGAREAHLVGEVYRRSVDAGDALVHELYTGLSGDGWSGAVLGVFVRDSDYGGFVRWLHRIGGLLSLLAVPVLLLVFGDALAVLGNLRLRLVAVLAAAALVPLVILSIVLVRVLESGHEADQRNDMQQAVATLDGQLREHQAQLVESGRTWLADLCRQFDGVDLVHSGDPAALLEQTLKPVMQNQMPPAWKEDGGYLSFEFSPAEEMTAIRPFSVFTGGARLRSLGTPLRTEPGIYLLWGIPLTGVRCEQDVPALGRCSLSVGRRLDEAFLADLAPGRGIVLYDTRGYPLSSAGSEAIGRGELSVHGATSAMIAEREQIKQDVIESGQPAIRRHRIDEEPWIAVYQVLRDLRETPRLLIGLVSRAHQATLPLAMGRVPVRSFFVSVAGLLLVLSIFLSFVVTNRISRPIDDLERGAQALSRGELDVHVTTDEGGQIGRLTRTFNQMALDLRGRIQDLRSLNRGIQDLTSKLELRDVLASAAGFYARHGSADCVRILLLDRDRERLVVFGGREAFLDRESPDVHVLLGAVGPLSMKLHGPAGHGALSRQFAEYRSMIGLPLVLAGSTRGAVLLLFESAAPNPVNLDLLWTMAAQTSAAIENARLYRHAVEDLYTGALRPEFFKTRVVQEASSAQADGRSLCLLGLWLSDGAEIAEALGRERYGRFLECLVAAVREHTGTDAPVCRASDEELQVLLCGRDRAAGQDVLAELQRRLGDVEVPGQAQPLRVAAGLAVFPEEAASAEYLFDALATRLHSGTSPSLPVRARGRDLSEEGVFLDSPSMERVVHTLERVASTDITVLLTGETGTGKEVFANLLHRWSKRASGPLVKVHCAAIPESLLQSELFGHEKGAFTGAVEKKPGRFEQAHGGTIFLDEIGEISLDVQVNLLRVLQEREIDRVGGTRPIPVDVRVLAATNRDVEEMVAAGTFREDLYYRLQGMMIRVPPLRDRKPEIPRLIEHFRKEAVAAGHAAVKGFSTDAIDELFRRDWPGNIRELRNAVFRAMIMARGEMVTRADLLGLTGDVADADLPVGPETPRGTKRAAEESSPERPPVTLPRPDGPPHGARPAGELPVRLQAAYDLARQRGADEGLSTDECAGALGISRRTALRTLVELQGSGLIERRGKRRGARYFPAAQPAP